MSSQTPDQVAQGKCQEEIVRLRRAMYSAPSAYIRIHRRLTMELLDSKLATLQAYNYGDWQLINPHSSSRDFLNSAYVILEICESIVNRTNERAMLNALLRVHRNNMRRASLPIERLNQIFTGNQLMDLEKVDENKLYSHLCDSSQSPFPHVITAISYVKNPHLCYLACHYAGSTRL